MPKRLSKFAQWVQRDFLAHPSAKQLDLHVAFPKGRILATSQKFDPGLSLYFMPTEVILPFEVNGETIDLLRCYEMYPKRNMRGGYFCSECQGEKVVFGSVRDMYFDHCLKPLLEDIESGLLTKPIHWEIFPSGSSYAKFVVNDPNQTLQ
jgi:hypothetical protein